MINKNNYCLIAIHAGTVVPIRTRSWVHSKIHYNADEAELCLV